MNNLDGFKTAEEEMESRIPAFWLQQLVIVIRDVSYFTQLNNIKLWDHLCRMGETLNTHRFPLTVQRAADRTHR